jgi:N utilization substance protein B
MGIRRKGREITVQTIYSLEFVNNGFQIKDKELKNKLLEIAADKGIDEDSNIFEFAQDLLNNIVPNLNIIDDKIKEHSTNWTFDRIAKLDLSIMRIAVYEMLLTELAPAIAMNEAIEIAKKYCSGSSSKFINGVLNAVAKEMNKNNKENNEE